MSGRSIATMFSEHHEDEEQDERVDLDKDLVKDYLYKSNGKFSFSSDGSLRLQKSHFLQYLRQHHGFGIKSGEKMETLYNRVT